MHTYVVRIVSSTTDADDLRGVVRRVADGSEHPFHGSEQLVALLQADDDSATTEREGRT